MSQAILLLRSGRHMPFAVAALRAAFPGSRVVVVAQPGTDHELEQAAVGPGDRIVYRRGRFAALRVLFSRAMLGVLAVRPARVAVLWNDPDGHGLRNVTRTGFLLGRGRVIPITPEGVLPARRWWAGMAARLDRGLERAGQRWDAWRVRVEGAELEPPVWHSHFLTAGPSEAVLAELGRRLRGRVLDIGAGTGYAKRFLDAGRTKYLPTDLPTGRDSADTAISRRASGPRVYCAGQALPFRDESVDSVISFSVLEHVIDVPGILRDAYRVLRPGGHVLVSTPFFFPFHGEPDDYRRWTAYGLAAELRACGFEIEEVRRIGTSVASLVLNLHLVVKYEWRESASPLLRFMSRWAWPAVLPWQALTNVFALAMARLEPESRMPLGIAVMARRPDVAP